MSSKKCHEQAKKNQTPCKKETHVTKVVGKKTKDLNIVKLLPEERSWPREHFQQEGNPMLPRVTIAIF
jgi:hypothetical protein